MLPADLQELEDEAMKEVEVEDFKGNYNASPGQNILIRKNESHDKLTYAKWGLIPFWAKDPSIGNKMINARAETISEKSSFKNAFNKRRCLIPAGGFYEWKKEESAKRKTPYFIFLKDRSLFYFAGLWEKWKNSKGETIETTTIITTKPNEMMKELHHRMPVILQKEKSLEWLNSNNKDNLLNLLNPIDASLMDAYIVSTMVNSPSNNSASLIERVY